MANIVATSSNISITLSTGGTNISAATSANLIIKLEGSSVAATSIPVTIALDGLSASFTTTPTTFPVSGRYDIMLEAIIGGQPQYSNVGIINVDPVLQ